MNATELSRVLYTLLDSAADEGRLKDHELVLRWAAIAERFHEAEGEVELPALGWLLEELERRGALRDSWISARWRAMKLKSAWRAAPQLEPWCKARPEAADA
jgi:hypothetical protein